MLRTSRTNGFRTSHHLKTGTSRSAQEQAGHRSRITQACACSRFSLLHSAGVNRQIAQRVARLYQPPMRRERELRIASAEQPFAGMRHPLRHSVRLTRRASRIFQFAFCGYNEIMVTWDETKRIANIRDHGFDFVGCEAVFDGPITSQEDDRLDYGEQRINLLGWLAAQVVHLTYTERGDDCHVISLRKATKHETRDYFSRIHP